MANTVKQWVDGVFSHRNGDDIPERILNELWNGIYRGQFEWDTTQIGQAGGNYKLDETGSFTMPETSYIKDIPVAWVPLSEPVPPEFQKQTFNRLRATLRQIEAEDIPSCPEGWNTVGHYENDPYRPAEINFQFYHHPPGIGISCSPAMQQSPELITMILSRVSERLQAQKITTDERASYRSGGSAVPYDGRMGRMIGESMIDQLMNAIKRGDYTRVQPYTWRSGTGRREQVMREAGYPSTSDSFQFEQQLEDVVQVSVPLAMTIPTGLLSSTGNELTRALQGMYTDGLPENWNHCAQVFDSEFARGLKVHFGISHSTGGQTATFVCPVALEQNKDLLLEVLNRVKESMRQIGLDEKRIRDRERAQALGQPQR